MTMQTSLSTEETPNGYGPVYPTEVRLIKSGVVMQPFKTLWTSDSCRLPGRRYNVLHSAGWQEHAWWEVVTEHDDARTRYLKWRKNKELTQLRYQIRGLEAELKRRETYG